MATERDYYEVLGISRDADQKSIKDAYHRLAMKWHPDRNKSPDAEAHFKEIAKSYAILSNPEKRAQYDGHGFEGVAHFTDEDLYRNIDLGSLFGNLGFGFGPGGDSIFDRFFGGRARRTARGQDLRFNLEVSLKRIAEGGKETIRYNRPITCKVCDGHGTASGKAPQKCKTCNGSGHQIQVQKSEKKKGQTINIQQIISCADCHGHGTIIEATCKKCGGSGKLDKIEKLRLDIPVGIEDGMTLRVPHHGLSGGPGAERGDLHVVIFAAPDTRFQRRGADLWRAETLQISDAVLGCTLRVPTLNDHAEVKIPAGTQPNEILRLRGKGLPRFGNSGNGDINLRIQLHIPKHLSVEELKLFTKLRELQGKRH